MFPSCSLPLAMCRNECPALWLMLWSSGASGSKSPSIPSCNFKSPSLPRVVWAKTACFPLGAVYQPTATQAVQTPDAESPAARRQWQWRITGQGTRHCWVLQWQCTTGIVINSQASATSAAKDVFNNTGMYSIHTTCIGMYWVCIQYQYIPI